MTHISTFINGIIQDAKSAVNVQEIADDLAFELAAGLEIPGGKISYNEDGIKIAVDLKQLLEELNIEVPEEEEEEEEDFDALLTKMVQEFVADHDFEKVLDWTKEYCNHEEVMASFWERYVEVEHNQNAVSPPPEQKVTDESKAKGLIAIFQEKGESDEHYALRLRTAYFAGQITLSKVARMGLSERVLEHVVFGMERP